MEKLESGTIVNVRPLLCNIVLLGFGFLFHVGILMMFLHPFYGSCLVVRWWFLGEETVIVFEDHLIGKGCGK